jgi:inosine/xanthosine triphosphate pyrophosphatase family protein
MEMRIEVKGKFAASNVECVNCDKVYTLVRKKDVKQTHFTCPFCLKFKSSIFTERQWTGTIVMEGVQNDECTGTSP